MAKEDEVTAVSSPLEWLKEHLETNPIADMKPGDRARIFTTLPTNELGTKGNAFVAGDLITPPLTDDTFDSIKKQLETLNQDLTGSPTLESLVSLDKQEDTQQAQRDIRQAYRFKVISQMLTKKNDPAIMNAVAMYQEVNANLEDPKAAKTLRDKWEEKLRAHIKPIGETFDDLLTAINTSMTGCKEYTFLGDKGKEIILEIANKKLKHTEGSARGAVSLTQEMLTEGLKARKEYDIAVNKIHTFMKTAQSQFTSATELTTAFNAEIQGDDYSYILPPEKLQIKKKLVDNFIRSKQYYEHTPTKDAPKGRWSAFEAKIAKNMTQIKDELKSLKGDQLKAGILTHFRTLLLDCKDKAAYDQQKDTIKNSDEYKILEKGQGVTTRLFGLKTSSIKAYEDMIKDMDERFAEQAPSGPKPP